MAMEKRRGGDTGTSLSDVDGRKGRGKIDESSSSSRSALVKNKRSDGKRRGKKERSAHAATFSVASHRRLRNKGKIDGNGSSRMSLRPEEAEG